MLEKSIIVSNVKYELKFGEITEDIFSRKGKFVDNTFSTLSLVLIFDLLIGKRMLKIFPWELYNWRNI